jgi:phosphoribosylformylglycinamidine synthase
VAIAECCFGPNAIGASVSLDETSRPEIALFHEGPSRIILSTTEPDKVRKIASEHRVGCAQIGVTMKERLQIRKRSGWLVDSSLSDLKEPWEKSLDLPGIVCAAASRPGERRHRHQ